MPLTILMYHEVVRDDAAEDLSRKINPSYVVTASVFEQHLRAIGESGAEVVSADDVHAWLCDMGSLPEKSVLITFDDGFAGNHAIAFPILRSFGYTATFFVVTNKIGDELMMSWGQLKALNDGGMTVGSHTVSHPLLSTLDREETELELARSAELIESEVGERARHLSLPNGDTNDWVRDIADATGYRTVCASRFGRNEKTSNRFHLNRIAVKRTTTAQDIAAYVNGSWRVFAAASVKEVIKVALVRLLTKKRYDALYNRFFGVDEQRKGHAH